MRSVVNDLQELVGGGKLKSRGSPAARRNIRSAVRPSPARPNKCSVAERIESSQARAWRFVRGIRFFGVQQRRLKVEGEMVGELDLDLTEADFQRVCKVVYDHCGISSMSANAIWCGPASPGRSDPTHSHRPRNILIMPGGFIARGFAHFIDAISTNLTSFFASASTSTTSPRPFYRLHVHASRRLAAGSCARGVPPARPGRTLYAGHDAIEFGGRLVPADMRILATDISTRVLEVARPPLSSPAVVERARRLPPALLHAH